MCNPTLVLLLCSLLHVAAAATREAVVDQGPSTYIVHVAHTHAPRPSRNTARLTCAYTSFLHDTLPTHVAEPAPEILYSYAHAMTGFAAHLTTDQAAHLEAQASVLAVVPDTTYELHTTLSPAFLGLTPSSGLMAASNGATDAVIAIIDTGIYPLDRASFAADPSLGPPPRTFRGGCASTPVFNGTAYCNNKLVGAKVFYAGYEKRMKKSLDEIDRSPLDTNGHGTHCASIAAGLAVPNASFFGFGMGTAQGMAPGARIASYKVCWGKTCTETDILAAVDEAIADNVDVISMSLGGPMPELYKEATAIASFNAVRRGIFVAASAGNRGPSRPVSNIAPWLITVGASTMNREFSARVNLGNGNTFVGTSLYDGNDDAYGQMKPLVYGGDAGSQGCFSGRLKASKVAGKVVFCDANGPPAAQAVAVKEAGGVGAIISGFEDNGEYAADTAFLLPALTVPFADAQEIKEYAKTTPNATASIGSFGTVISSNATNPPAYPMVASFSSRGPNRFAKEILKPDVIAPGVGILAAWTGANAPSTVDADTRRVKFNIMAGTSMATPHVSGIAALLKAARPSWSPAAIKSAMMTTVYSVDSSRGTIKDMATGEAAGPFEFGAGHVDPNRALDPGLVYDAGVDNYIDFLCGLNYTTEQMMLFTGNSAEANCSARGAVVTSSSKDLNYPAFVVVFNSSGGHQTVRQRRVVRNVGSNVNAVYTLAGVPPAGVKFNISIPSRTGQAALEFDDKHQTAEYTAIFEAVPDANFTGHTYGSLTWSDGKHKVVSPIAVIWETTPSTGVADM